MIVLDTHAWVWWVDGEERLTVGQAEIIKANETSVIGVSAISCWEIAKLAKLERLKWMCSLEDWFAQALSYPGIRLLELTPEIAIESTRLPGMFHKDPADQIIVATARVNGCPLVTADDKILRYEGVETVR